MSEGQGGEGAAKENAVCRSRDETLIEQHSAWTEADNSFGELAGTKWRGLFGQRGNQQTTLDVDLDLLSAEAGTLQVGPKGAAPKKNEPLLDAPPDGVLEQPLFYGGTYELRGAAFADGELTAFIPLSAPFDDWCALQTSYSHVAGNPEYCQFSPVPYEALFIGAEAPSCHLEPSMNQVDCNWYFQSTEHCMCTSSECFASVVFPVLREWETFEDYAADGLSLRITYDEEQNLLRGVGLWQEAEYYIELARGED